MFTIEHEFDCTVITVLDEDVSHLNEDVIVTSFEDCVTVEQYDAHSDRMQKITLSLGQIREIAAALHLPEGIYQLDTVQKSH